MLVSALSSLYPAWLAMRVTPRQAMPSGGVTCASRDFCTDFRIASAASCSTAAHPLPGRRHRRA